jgi:hypothetical protein
VDVEELEAGKSLVTRFDTVLRHSWTSGAAISRLLDGLEERKLWAQSATSAVER